MGGGNLEFFCCSLIVLVYYINMFDTAADFLEEHRRVLESRLQPVVREITDSRARTREELESLYRKIVSAVLLRSGLGSPTDIAVVREATGKIQTDLLLTKFNKLTQFLHLGSFLYSI